MLPKYFERVVTFFLSEKRFLALLYARLILSLVVFFYSSFIVFFLLLLISLMVCLRFRGTFNGGSDYMTMVILLSMCISNISESNASYLLAGLCYIAIQVTLSYFVAGVIKAFKSSWRNGTSLSIFLTSSPYPLSPAVTGIIKNRKLMMGASWAVIAFECSAPLVFFIDGFPPLFLAVAVLFHVSTVYVFGLNRFLFAWLSAYPALYFLSTFSLRSFH